MTSAYLHNMGLILDMTKKNEFTKDEALAAKTRGRNGTNSRSPTNHSASR
jgi:hypothetical protein